MFESSLESNQASMDGQWAWHCSDHRTVVYHRLLIGFRLNARSGARSPTAVTCCSHALGFLP